MKKEITEAIKEINKLQTYVMYEGGEKLVERGEVIEILKGIGKQPNKCRDCEYLDMDDTGHSVGYPCKRPNHTWRTMTAHLKYAHTPACKAFKPRKGANQ